ncbi:MAG: 6-carboxytetrahydropterin synthase [Bacteroidales bacterium]|nr:6-carboxytetrahydropterin synthase [Bacteroidales bacterium]
MVYITRRERFSAAHRMYKDGLTDQENLALYGKCANSNWHGHNYVLYVTVKGEVDIETGYLVDLGTLSKIINRHVIDKLDHKNINLDVDFMQGKIVSTENLAISIWEQLELHIKKLGVTLHSIKLEETENNFIEYYGK